MKSIAIKEVKDYRFYVGENGKKYISRVTLQFLQDINQDMGLGVGDGELGGIALANTFKRTIELFDRDSVDADMVELACGDYYDGYLDCLKERFS